MRSLQVTHRIAELIAQLATEVESLQAMSFTDINRAMQNVICRLFAVVYDLPNLRNLDLSEAVNFPAVDLGDDVKRIAIQVTGDPSGKKVKDTLRKFVEHGLHSRFDRLKFYCLTQNQGRYQASLAIGLPSGFEFDRDRDILDRTTLLRAIEGLTQGKRLAILEILEQEYGDGGLSGYRVSAEELGSLRDVFVPPAEFGAAGQLLHDQGFLVLTGPPHIGKSATGLSLLGEAAGTRSGSRILRLPSDRVLEPPLSLNGEFILLDDAFGEVSFDRPTVANAIASLIRLAKHNKIVVTSRIGVLTEAQERSKFGERSDLNTWKIELAPEVSFDDDRLAAVYQRHLDQRVRFDERFTPTDEEISTFRKLGGYVTHQLRFPHNIERFIQGLSAGTAQGREIDWAIARAKDITAAARRWFEALSALDQTRVAVAALCPDLGPKHLAAALEVLGLTSLNEQLLAKRSNGFLRQGRSLQIAHPSYRQGIFDSLRSDLRPDAARVLRAVANTLQELSLDSIAPLMLAQQLLNRSQSMFESDMAEGSIEPIEYYTRYATAYNQVIDQDFPAIRQLFAPNDPSPCRVHLYLSPKDDVLGWSILPRLKHNDEVTTSHELPDFRGHGLTSVEEELLASGKGRHFSWHLDSQHSTRIPEVAALEEVWKQLVKVIRDAKEFPFGDTLSHAAIDRGLASTDFPLSEVGPERPLTGDWIRTWFEPYFTGGIGFTLPAGRIFPQKRLVIQDVPPTVNDLDIEWAARFADRLADAGKPITERFLVQPDCPWEAPLYRDCTTGLDGWYSDDQLSKAVEVAMTKRLAAVREVIGTYFPKLSKRLRYFAMGSGTIVCILNRDKREGLTPAWIIYGQLPGDGPADGVASIDVHTLSRNVTEADRVNATSIQEQLSKRRLTGSSTIYSLIEINQWTDFVLGDIRRSLEHFLEEWKYRLYEARD